MDRIQRVMPLTELPPHEASETARRYTFADGVGEIGIIAPVTQAFCGACSRVRLTSDGKIRTCLFSQQEHDLYGRMRRGADETELREFIFVRFRERKHAIISANQAFSSPRARWCTSADNAIRSVPTTACSHACARAQLLKFRCAKRARV